MKLSQKIPESLKSQTPDFADQILEKRCAFSECGWAIHPVRSPPTTDDFPTTLTRPCARVVCCVVLRMCVVQGGKSILAGIEQVLGLQRWQTECSWEVLKNYGNMVRCMLYCVACMRWRVCLTLVSRDSRAPRSCSCSTSSGGRGPLRPPPPGLSAWGTPRNSTAHTHAVPPT